MFILWISICLTPCLLYYFYLSEHVKGIAGVIDSVSVVLMLWAFIIFLNPDNLIQTSKLWAGMLLLAGVTFFYIGYKIKEE